MYIYIWIDSKLEVIYCKDIWIDSNLEVMYCIGIWKDSNRDVIYFTGIWIDSNLEEMYCIGIWIDSNLEVMYALATRITFICPMRFNAFPMDIQVFLNVAKDNRVSNGYSGISTWTQGY